MSQFADTQAFPADEDEIWFETLDIVEALVEACGSLPRNSKTRTVISLTKEIRKALLSAVPPETLQTYEQAQADGSASV